MTERRVIVHADMDAFYAAVEILDEPSLAGQPLIVGHPGGRGVVTTASYEARKYGIGSAMPMAHALRRCPHAVVRAPRFERYSHFSKIVRGVFEVFTERVEPLSIDEAFLDMTDSAGGFASPRALGAAIKRGVKEATEGLTVSVGIANTKFLAKVASDFDKPDGLTIVPPDQAIDFLAPLPVKRLWGAGPKTAAKLEALGYQTIGDIAAADPATLGLQLGRMGLHFHRLAHNIDTRKLVTSRRAKSIGCERTLAEDITGAEAVKVHLRSTAEELARRLGKRDTRVLGLRVKLKTADFRLMTRQTRLREPTNDEDRLYDAAVTLLADFAVVVQNAPLRLVGLAGYDLIGAEEPEQLWLFEPGEL